MEHMGHIRVSEEAHRTLKVIAAKRGVTITQAVDDMLRPLKSVEGDETVPATAERTRETVPPTGTPSTLPQKYRELKSSTYTRRPRDE